jgi:protease I
VKKFRVKSERMANTINYKGGSEMRKGITKSLGILVAMSFIFAMSAVSGSAASPFIKVAKETGIDIVKIDEAIVWKGPYGGKIKPKGPLAGKKVGLIVGCEFSDWQAYYLAEFIAEFGGTPQFIMSNNHLWKETRPIRGTPTHPHGMWGLSLTGGMAGLGLTGARSEPAVLIQKGAGDVADLPVADPAAYDAFIILGGHSGDLLLADDVAIKFIKAAAARGVPMAGIGGGILPLIKLGVMNGKKCTGNRVVDYMLKEIGEYRNEAVVVDGNIITGRDTYDTPAVLRALCKVMDPGFKDKHKGILKGKKVMCMVAEDWEDVELCAPTMELMYRGADYVVGLFPPQMKSRPALLGLDVRTGSFGTTVPFQEIPDSYYKIIKKEDLSMDDFDLLFIPGAFNPWRLTITSRDFLRDAYGAGKIVASICHGPIPVAAADLVRGKKCAGWLACEPSVKIMGGTYNWDWSAVIDGRIVTGRVPMDVPEFVDAMTEALLAE